MCIKEETTTYIMYNIYIIYNGKCRIMRLTNVPIKKLHLQTEIARYMSDILIVCSRSDDHTKKI